MNKNNFDDFFREKFKEFEEVPDDKVWDAIESSLGKKKTKRGILPIWWKLGGVAALLTVLFYIANPFGDSSSPAVVDTESLQTEKSIKNKENRLENDGIDNKNEDTEVVQSPQNDAQVNPLIPADKNTQADAIPPGNKQLKVASVGDESKLNSSNPATVQNERQLASNLPNTVSDKALEDAKKQTQGEILVNTPAIDALSVAEKEDDKNNIPKGIEVLENVVNDTLAEVADNVEKKSIFDEIAQEEEIVVDDAGENKWSIGPSVAPVYFSSFGEGSPIHSNFASNSKSGNLNFSYGLSVSYTVSKKLSLRSGVHKVDYGYDTNDIQFSSSLAASTNNRIDNIDYALTSKNLVVQSSANELSSQDASLAISNEIGAPSPTRDGRMVQQFGYLEVPVELNYALIDTKLGVNIIGGISSLFLVDNTVSLESGGAATDIGEANNINSLNFSTNIGFGFNYELSPKVQLNLEPMFKYQLNTFSDTSGSFQPFSVGVYSGLSFKF